MKIGIINCIEFSQFFAQVGFRCPSRRNPSDHFLRCVNSDFDHVNATLRGSLKILKKTVFTLSLPLSVCRARSLFLSLAHSRSFFSLPSLSPPISFLSLASALSLANSLVLCLPHSALFFSLGSAPSPSTFISICITFSPLHKLWSLF